MPRPVGFLVIAVAIALALDLPSMSSGMWCDEWFTLEYCRHDWATMARFAAQESSPPTYLFLTWLLFRVVPPNPVTVRLLSVAAHVGCLVILYFYATTWHGEAVARTATLALAANPAMAWNCTNGRVYALVAAAALACVGAFRSRRWGLFAVTAALIGWLHYLALMVPVFLYAWEIARVRTFRTPATAAGVGAFLLWAPLLPHVLATTLSGPMTYDWLDLGLALQTMKWWLGLDCLPATAVLATSLALAILVILDLRRYAFEAWLWLAPIILFSVAGAWVAPVYSVKQLLWTLPLAQVCIAAALTRRGLPLAACWLAIVLAGGIQHAGHDKDPTRAWAQAIAARMSPRDRIVLTPGAHCGPMDWYLPRMPRLGTGAPTTWLVERLIPRAPDWKDDYRVIDLGSVSPTQPATWAKRSYSVLEPDDVRGVPH